MGVSEVEGGGGVERERVVFEDGIVIEASLERSAEMFDMNLVQIVRNGCIGVEIDS